MAWILLFGAIGFEVAGTLSLRASEGFSRWQWAIPVTVGYLVSFVLLALVLKRGIPVGVAYGVWSGVGVALTAALARFLFADPFTPVMAGGVVLIGAGVYLLEYGAHA
ncbi:QacE family quaternary ammonium compound efflux SMR transporter [Mycolicibacter kumamotonensis]|uniref:QacE family quaternary ammonium compound efflux SMR transporter n=1 Tax=Mycolicibacter kumamotonensis TaxID=354243 RepID=A0A1X0DZ46_9MYCO|nr:multidrug efflux SMR transporter [Mycolicibacter kumamotonensis]ORA77627.1 QacE family quaternary ammonium compound efflux SMR transporter [Mycolicibacter kumamotonensis]